MTVLQFVFDTIIVIIDYLFVYYYCSIFFEKKRNNLKLFIYLVIYAIFNQLVYLVINNLFVDIVLNLFYCFALAHFCFYGSIIKKIMHSTLFYLIIGLLTSLLLLIFNYILRLDAVVLFQFTYERVSFIITSKMFVFLILHISKKTFDKKEIYDFDLTNKHQTTVVFLSLAIFSCTLILFFICLFENSPFMKLTLIVVSIILFLIDVIMFVVFYNLDNTIRENNTLKVISTINRIEKNNFDNLEKKQLIVQNIKHDLTNTLLAIYQVFQDRDIEKAEKLITKVVGEITEKTNYINTGNRIIDSLLNYYSDLNENIHFQTIIQLDYSINIDDIDLIAILGNLLSNAVEATTKIVNNNNSQTIYIQIKSTIDHIYMMIKNPYERDYSNIDSLATTKDSKEEHGFGINQIKRMVAKNNGVFDLYVDRNDFIAKISVENIQGDIDELQ